MSDPAEPGHVCFNLRFNPSPPGTLKGTLDIHETLSVGDALGLTIVRLFDQLRPVAKEMRGWKTNRFDESCLSVIGRLQ
jgi:hypothetical protein